MPQLKWSGSRESNPLPFRSERNRLPLTIDPDGRAGEIRTRDLMHPMHARYQTTLQPENGDRGQTRTGDLFHVKEVLLTN